MFVFFSRILLIHIFSIQSVVVEEKDQRERKKKNWEIIVALDERSYGEKSKISSIQKIAQDIQWWNSLFSHVRMWKRENYFLDICFWCFVVRKKKCLEFWRQTGQTDQFNLADCTKRKERPIDWRQSFLLQTHRFSLGSKKWKTCVKVKKQ